MKIVTVGGGTGQYHVLRALMALRVRVPNISITAIPTTSDSGGSSGILRLSCNIVAPGDISQCVLGLHPEPERVELLFGHRLNGGGLEGHSVRNLIVTAALQQFGGTQGALDSIEYAFRLSGRVTPVSFSPTHLRTKLRNGDVLKDEDALYRRDIVAAGGIEHLWLAPEPEPNPAALEAIACADALIVCPGTLLCSIIPNFLVPGIREALSTSSARKICIANLTNRRGHVPDTWTVLDHIHCLERYLCKNFFTDVIANIQPLAPEQEVLYDASSIVPALGDELHARQSRLITAELLGEIAKPATADVLADYRATVRHDPERLAFAIEQTLS